jgi:hypothetical protein
VAVWCATSGHPKGKRCQASSSAFVDHLSFLSAASKASASSAKPLSSSLRLVLGIDFNQTKNPRGCAVFSFGWDTSMRTAERQRHRREARIATGARWLWRVAQQRPTAATAYTHHEQPSDGVVAAKRKRLPEQAGPGASRALVPEGSQSEVNRPRPSVTARTARSGYVLWNWKSRAKGASPMKARSLWLDGWISPDQTRDRCWCQGP